jgi:competence protein ComEC
MTRLTLSFIAGIAVFHFFPFFPVTIVTAGFAVIIFLFFSYKKERKKIFPLLFIFLFSLFYCSARHADLPELSLPDFDISVTGTIIDVPEMSDEKLGFTLDNVSLGGKKIEGRVRLVVFRKYFSDLLIDNLPVPGDRVSAIAKLKEPHIFQNPGIPSYDLKKHGIIAAGYVKQIQVISRSTGLMVWMNNQRQRLGMIMDNSLSEENAAFHKAIIPGLKKSIGVDMRDAFSATGLAHLLSISGTHFGLLAFIIFKIVRMSIQLLPPGVLVQKTLYITPTQVAVAVTIPVLVLYALISGASTPTIRSFIMVFIYMAAVFIGRKDQWLNSLSIAALIILLWKPEGLFELSFQLSFLAVFSIGYVLEQRAKNKEQRAKSIEQIIKSKERRTKMAEHRLKILEKLGTAVMLTIAAVLGTAPLVAVYFKQFPLISPITNLVVTPLVCFLVLPLGFFSGFISLMFNLSAMPLSGLADSITHIVFRLIKGFSQIPYSNLHVHNPSVLMIILYYSSLIFMIRHSGPDTDGGSEKNQSKIYLRFLPFIFVIFIYMISPYLSSGKLRVTLLDIGQGDSAVVELPDKKVMLIDGGTHEPDMGRRVVAPYLWSQGIRKVDYLVSSHSHSDHFGGLMYILDNFDIGEIWFNGRLVSEADESFQRILEKGVPYKIPGRGDVLEREKYKVYVLHPYHEFYAGSPRGKLSNQNNYSLVLRIESNNTSVLFTGDIEMEAEENLLHLGEWLESDIIKVPHHGSSMSNSGEFIRAVSPDTAVVSAGRKNPFKHPHQETLWRYKDAGVRLLRTDADGAVTIISGGDAYELKTYEDSRFKKVDNWRDEIRNLRLLF